MIYDQLTNLTDGVHGEIIHATLHTQSRPSGKHGLAELALGIRVGYPYGFFGNKPGGWWILPEPEIHFVLNQEIAIPDLAGWKRERMPQVPDDQRFIVTPDWICEILSPSTTRRDRAIKLPLYAHYGVPFAWLIDPFAHTLEAFALHDGMWTLLTVLSEDDTVCVAPFDATSFTLADLWG